MITGVSKRETKQYGRVVIFLNFAYLHIVYVTSIDIIYPLSMYSDFQSKINVNERETEQYAERDSAIV